MRVTSLFVFFWLFLLLNLQEKPTDMAYINSKNVQSDPQTMQGEHQYTNYIYDDIFE